MCQVIINTLQPIQKLLQQRCLNDTISFLQSYLWKISDWKGIFTEKTFGPVLIKQTHNFPYNNGWFARATNESIYYLPKFSHCAIISEMSNYDLNLLPVRKVFQSFFTFHLHRHALLFYTNGMSRELDGFTQQTLCVQRGSSFGVSKSKMLPRCLSFSI